MPIIGLFSGKKIKELARKKQRLTRKQTAIQAKNNILRKYKKIIDSRRYYYGGNQNWILYSKKKDAQRTGKTTEDKKKWGKQPHKWDYKGVDTKSVRESTQPQKRKTAKKSKALPLSLNKRSKKSEDISLPKSSFTRKSKLSNDEQAILKQKESISKRSRPSETKSLEREIKAEQSATQDVRGGIDKQKRLAGQLKVREWAATPSSNKITPRAGFLVYDFLTGRFDSTLKDLKNKKVTKQQVYAILDKIEMYGALPGSAIKNYRNRVYKFRL